MCLWMFADVLTFSCRVICGEMMLNSVGVTLGWGNTIKATTSNLHKKDNGSKRSGSEG